MMNLALIILFVLVLAFVDSFTTTTYPLRRAVVHCRTTALRSTSRRSFLAAPVAIAGTSILSLPSPAHAIVYYDPMLYGDAELKVAVINRVRQKVRDAITKDPQLGVELFTLGIADSLKFNAATQEGGGDGSVTKVRGERSEPW